MGTNSRMAGRGLMGAAALAGLACLGTAPAMASSLTPPRIGTLSSRAAIAAPAAGPFGRAIEVPGLGTLNAGGAAGVLSVSCASAGNCAAGGDYTDRHGQGQGFVLSQRHGVWGRASEVLGPGGIGFGEVISVSCASAGNCAAGGSDGFGQGFVVSQQHGVWGRAIQVHGLSALSAGGFSRVTSVSCASAGNCAAGGYYENQNHADGGFVVSERNGRWRRAIEVPGLGALNTNRAAAVTSVSCASAGDCAAAGYYRDRSADFQGFVASERDGVWGRAIEVPGLGALSTQGYAAVSSVSCASAGNCAAGGKYDSGGSAGQAFVVSEKNGRWGTALPIPGMDDVTSLSCASPGNCSAGGGLVAVSEENGTWGKAQEVPGLGALNTGGNVGVTSVSCASAGNCAAGGYYTDRRGHIQGFLAVQRHAVWHPAFEVPGPGILNAGGNAGIDSVSCPPAGNCAAGGHYTDRGGHGQGFVV